RAAASRRAPEGPGMVRPLAEAGLLDRDRKLARTPRRRDRVHDKAPAGGGLTLEGADPSWRMASPAAMAADRARLRLRPPPGMGIVTRWSASAWTSSGTPADSRPKRRMSPVARAKSV